MLSDAQISEFAERGYIVVPQVVPAGILDRAAQRIDALVDADPPAADTRGPHFYFLEAKEEPDLIAPLTGSPAFGFAGDLAGRDTLYFRISDISHASHQEEFLQDAWLDYEPVRSAAPAPPQARVD